MPSCPCAHCLKVKQCKMVRGVVTYEYLCGPCRREPGYALPGAPDDRDEGGEA